MVFITIMKLGIYFLRKKYRLHLGGNVRKVVIIGLNQKTDQLRKFFTTNPVYGYKLYKTFDLKGPDKVSIEECMDYILKEDRKSTRLNSSHVKISYAVFCLKK